MAKLKKNHLVNLKSDIWYDDDDDDNYDDYGDGGDSNNNNNNNNNNKPDIIRDNEKRTCMLIDVAIPGDRNVVKKRSRDDFKI